MCHEAPSFGHSFSACKTSFPLNSSLCSLVDLSSNANSCISWKWRQWSWVLHLSQSKHPLREGSILSQSSTVLCCGFSPVLGPLLQTLSNQLSEFVLIYTDNVHWPDMPCSCLWYLFCGGGLNPWVLSMLVDVCPKGGLWISHLPAVGFFKEGVLVQSCASGTYLQQVTLGLFHKEVVSALSECCQVYPAYEYQLVWYIRLNTRYAEAPC